MEIPDEFKGKIEGMFFKRNQGTYTFVAIRNNNFESEKKFYEEKLGYQFIKKIDEINTYFIRAANSFAAEKWSHKDIKAEDINLEEIIRYAHERGFGEKLPERKEKK